jgi:hypothetical protein
MGSDYDARYVPVQLRLLPDLWLADIQVIELSDQTDVLTFRRFGQREWRVSGTDIPGSVLADSARMDRLLDRLEFARSGPRPESSAPNSTPSQSATIRIQGASGERVVEIDRYASGTAYLREKGGASGWLRDTRLADLVFGPAEDWVDPRLMPVDPVRVVRIALETPAGRAELAIQGREWRYIQPVHARARQDEVLDYLSRISELKAPEAAASGILPTRAMQSGERRFRALLWTDAFSGAHELQVWENSAGEAWADYDNGRRRTYFPLGMPEELEMDPMSFVPEHLVRFQSSGVLGIQYRSADGVWSVQRSSPTAEWRVESPYQSQAEIEIVRDVLDVLGRLTVTRIIGSYAEPQADDFDARPGRIAIRLQFAHKQAWDVIGPAPTEPRLGIDLERLNPNGLVGARLDEKVLYAMDSSLSDGLSWAPELLRDRHVHSAAVSDFSSLNVRRGKDRLDWQESDSSSEWVEPWLRFLSDLRAARYCTRDPQRVSDYGLGEAGLEIDWTVRLEDTLIAHRLVFAQLDEAPVYGMLDESGWVFELDSDQSQALLLLLDEIPVQENRDVETSGNQENGGIIPQDGAGAAENL